MRLQQSLLEKLEEVFFKSAELSKDIICVRSENFQILLYANPAFERFFGFSCHKSLDAPYEWVNSIILEDRDRVRQTYMEWQVSPTPQKEYVTEYRIKNSKHDVHWFCERCFPVFDDGKCIAYVGQIQDITREKYWGKEVDQASYFFRYFVEKLQSVFWVRDKEGKKQLYISPAYEQVWGFSCDSLYTQPQSWLNAVLPEDREASQMDSLYYHVDEQSRNKPREFRFRIRKPNGEIRWIRDIHFPILEGKEIMGFAGIAEDVSNDVWREKELREAKEAAESANRAKSDFLAMMSHELRTPLNAILGMSQILKSSDIEEEYKDQIDVIIQAGQNLLSLLNDLLDFAKLELGKLSFSNDPIEFKTLISKVVSDMLPLAATKKLQLRLKYDEELPLKILGDAKRIRQILVNLLSNAIKFTERGHVQLSVNCLQKNKKEVTVCFTVEDTGLGIEKKKLSKIFNRFQPVDSVYQRKYDGIGLGLSIVKELVERMGGNIAVTSEVGVGSQFSCIISFQSKEQDIDSSSDLNNKVARTIAHSNRFNLSVLVVEDNLINQKISQIMLEQMGCRVDIAHCGNEALLKFKKPYDLIFMDIGLPDMDGFEAVTRIRREEQPGKRVPIVAMTAHVFAHDRERCFDAGMDEVMAKPIVQEDLIKILRRWSVEK